MTNEEYQDIKADLLEHPDWPYHFADLELAEEFYKRIIKEYPDTRMYFLFDGQFLCADFRAKRKLLDLLHNWETDLEKNRKKALEEVRQVIKEVEKDLI